jgi:REP element-mobilizing transposase RayT
MRSPYTQLYAHLIWSTWDRLPLITDELEPIIQAAMAAKCRQLKCELLAIGGIEDHVHLLVRFHPAVSIARLVQEIKGSSSHLISRKVDPGGFFKWQGAYQAFTIRKSEVPKVRAYIDGQKDHHASRV